MIQLLYTWFWWTTSLKVWSYWYSVSTVIFLIYYAIQIVFMFVGKRQKKKKHAHHSFYQPSSCYCEHEEEYSGTSEENEEDMYEHVVDDEESPDYYQGEEQQENHKEEDQSIQNLESDFYGIGSSGASFERNAPMSFDHMVAKLTRGITIACLLSVSLLVLIVFGGLFITFVDKLQEEKQLREAYHRAVQECNVKSIQSSEILKACQNAKREAGKSSIFGAVKKTFFEAGRSMDSCVSYLMRSPTAWFLIGLVIFIIACKMVWPDRDENVPTYLKWLHNRGFTGRKEKKRRRKKYKKSNRNIAPGYISVPMQSLANLSSVAKNVTNNTMADHSIGLHRRGKHVENSLDGLTRTTIHYTNRT